MPIAGTTGLFVTRGPQIATLRMHEAFNAAKLRGFDSLLVALDAIYADFDRRMGADGVLPNEVIIGGYSTMLRRPWLVYRSNRSENSGKEGGTVMEMQSFSTMRGRDPDIPTFDVDQGLAILEQQRRTPSQPLDGGKAIATVGGFVTYAVIQAGRVPKPKVVHTWPEDRVGAMLAA